MNDFLNKFNSENYKRDNKKETKVKTDDNIPNEEILEARAIKSTEHETEIDSSYKKTKTIKYIVIAVTVILLAVIIMFIIKTMNQVTVKNLTNMELSEAKSWALKNDIELDIKNSYNLKYNENIIFEQDIKEGTKISKRSIIYIKVSMGADPNELISIPSFTEMTTKDINNWIEENKVNAYTITEYSNEIESGKFIRIEFSNESVDEKNYTRKDVMTIYMSKGSELENKNITVPNFVDKTKVEVETWAKTAGVTIIYKEVGSSSIMLGNVVSQNIKEGTKISKTDIITVEISLGKGIVVPNFSNILKDDASTNYPDLQITIKTKYSLTVAYGRFISQSVASGKKLYGGNTQIELVYSEGKPYIEDLKGKTEKELPEYFYNFQLKGANITYQTIYVDSDEEKGTVISASKTNEYLSLEEIITVNISNGKNFQP